MSFSTGSVPKAGSVERAWSQARPWPAPKSPQPRIQGKGDGSMRTSHHGRSGSVAGSPDKMPLCLAGDPARVGLDYRESRG